MASQCRRGEVATLPLKRNCGNNAVSRQLTKGNEDTHIILVVSHGGKWSPRSIGWSEIGEVGRKIGVGIKEVELEEVGPGRTERTPACTLLGRRGAAGQSTESKTRRVRRGKKKGAEEQ